MRMDQTMGLNEWARSIVEGNPVILYHEESRRRYENGRIELIEERPIMGSDVAREVTEDYYEGMFGDQYPLYRYTFPDGRVLTESVQSNPWSAGPMFYLALKDERGEWVTESLWTDFKDTEPGEAGDSGETSPAG